MDIQVIAASQVPTPSAGYRTLFINTEDSNMLSWKDSNGTVTRFTDDDSSAECCACAISKDYADGILCALKSGMLSASEFTSLITLGFTASATESTDVDGNKTCTVTFGGTNHS